MLGLIQLLFYGHIHKWEIYKTVRLTNRRGSEGSRYTLRCEKCGNIKYKDLI